jgi:GT2 family glycosyltransferase
VPGNRWDRLDGVWPAVPPRVSVVVVHFEQPAQLARTLAALARQTHPPGRLEVIVADDGSRAAPAVPPGVTLVRQADRGHRAAAARNLGARAATGDVVCFLDADTVPEPGYVTRMARLPALAPEAVVVGRRRHADLAAVDPGAPIERAGPAHELPAPAWLAGGYAATRDLLDADHRSYRFVISAVLACSRWFLGAAGPFDERFDAYGGEDWEWAHRAWQAGALLAHEPAAVAWHDGPEWSARDTPGARRAAKNAEALRLAGLVPVPGSRGRAVRPLVPDVVVELAAAGDAAAAFVCADGVLAALPEAVVVVPPGVAGVFAGDPRVRGDAAPAGARVRVALPRPVRAEAGALRAAVDAFADPALGRLELLGDDGAVLARLDAARALARRGRWGAAPGFTTRRAPAAGLAPLPAEPDVEGYVGGWA